MEKKVLILCGILLFVFIVKQNLIPMSLRSIQAVY